MIKHVFSPKYQITIQKQSLQLFYYFFNHNKITKFFFVINGFFLDLPFSVYSLLLWRIPNKYLSIICSSKEYDSFAHMAAIQNGSLSYFFTTKPILYSVGILGNGENHFIIESIGAENKQFWFMCNHIFSANKV